MLNQTDSVSTSKINTKHSMHMAYASSAYDCGKSDILLSVVEAVFRTENIVDDSPFFVRMVQMNTDKTP